MKLCKIRTILVSLCLVMGSQLLTVSAVLADTKIYPATFCQLWGPDLRDGMSNFVGYSQFGSLANLHTTRTLHVVCPITRDNTQNTNGLDYLRVTFLNRHLTQAFTCTLYSINLNGETVIDSATLSADDSDNFQRFNFQGSNGVENSIRYTINGATMGSYYNLFCAIPPRIGDASSWLGAYVVNEFN